MSFDKFLLGVESPDLSQTDKSIVRVSYNNVIITCINKSPQYCKNVEYRASTSR